MPDFEITLRDRRTLFGSFSVNETAVIPRIPFSGVRSSCVMLAINRDLASLAFSA